MLPTPRASLSQVATDKAQTFAALLRFRRTERRMSQLDLALSSGVSQRHISFLESGRASPSRQVVLRLAEGMDASGRQRDELLLCGGFAPFFRGAGQTQHKLIGAEAATGAALRRVLERHEPYPAVVLDGLGYVQMANRTARHLSAMLVNQPIENLTLSVFDANALRPHIVNWAEVAHQHHLRIRREAALYAGTPEHTTFIHQFTRLAGDSAALDTDPTSLPDPTLVIDLRKGAIALQLLSMIMQFGAAYDPCLQETRIECFFPANDHSRRALEALSSDVPKSRREE